MNDTKTACRDISEALDRFLLDEAEEVEARDVEAHLAACPACRSAASAARAALAALRRTPAPPLDYGDVTARRVTENLHARNSVDRVAWRAPLVAAALLLAALALAVFAPAPEPPLESRVAAKARALNDTERAALMADFTDAEAWRRDGELASALMESLAGNGWDRALSTYGFSLDSLADDEWGVLHEFVSATSDDDLT